MSYLFLKIAFERRIAYFLNDDRRACSSVTVNLCYGNVISILV